MHISQISDEHVEKVRDVLQLGQEVEARVIKIDSDRAPHRPEHQGRASWPRRNSRSATTCSQGLRPGEDLVDLAGAFDEAFGSVETKEEWHPGESKQPKDDAAGE